MIYGYLVLIENIRVDLRNVLLKGFLIYFKICYSNFEDEKLIFNSWNVVFCYFFFLRKIV